MAQLFIKISSLILILIFGACSEVVDYNFNFDPNDVNYNVSILNNQAKSILHEKNSVALLLNIKTNSLYSCTSTLLPSGYVLTNAHCVSEDDSTKTLSGPQNIHLFFKNKNDSHPSHYTVNSIIAANRFLPSNEDMITSSLNNVETLRRASPILFSYIKKGQDWAILGIEKSKDALKKFGSIPAIDITTFNTVEFAVDFITNHEILEFNAIDPKANIVNGKLTGSYDLKTVKTSLHYGFFNSYFSVQLESGLNNDEAAVATFEKTKSFPLNGNDVISGNSGSSVLYKGKIIGLVYLLFSSSSYCDGKSCKDVGMAQWLPGTTNPTLFNLIN